MVGRRSGEWSDPSTEETVTIAASPPTDEPTASATSPREAPTDSTVPPGRDVQPRGRGPSNSEAITDRLDLDNRIRHFASHEYRRVVATVALWCGSTDDAADAVADALGKTWERLDKGQSIDNLAAFVTTSAMNRVRTQHRRAARLRRTRHLLAVIDSTDPADRMDRRLDVAFALRSLTRRQRDIIALRYATDLTTAQIAEQLGLAEGTVKATLHKARVVLAEQLGSPTQGTPR